MRMLAGSTLYQPVHELRAILTCTSNGIFSEDLRGIVQSWNPGAEKMFGYTEAEAVG